MKVKLLTCLLLVLFIVGCSTSSRPEGIREEIYNGAIKFITIMDERNSNDEFLSEDEHDMFNNFINHYKKEDLTLKESQVILKLMNLMVINIDIHAARVENNKKAKIESIHEYDIEKINLKGLLNI